MKTSRYEDNSIPVTELSSALLSTCLTLGTIMETCRLKKGNFKILNDEDVRKNWITKNILEEVKENYIYIGSSKENC